MEIDFKKEKGICDEAKQFIAAVSAKLSDVGAIEECDMGALRMLMVSYDMYVKASRELLEKGPLLYDRHGRPKVNPAATLTKNYYAQVLSFMKEYGLTVKSRERIKSMTPEVDEDNDILKFFKNEQ